MPIDFAGDSVPGVCYCRLKQDYSLLVECIPAMIIKVPSSERRSIVFSCSGRVGLSRSSSKAEKMSESS